MIYKLRNTHSGPGFLPRYSFRVVVDCHGRHTVAEYSGHDATDVFEKNVKTFRSIAGYDVDFGFTISTYYII